MGKQGEEETSGSEMPSRAYENKAVMGAPPTHTPHTPLSSPPHTLRTIRPEPMELGRRSEQIPEWGWNVSSLLFSAPSGVLFCLDIPTTSQQCHC